MGNKQQVEPTPLTYNEFEELCSCFDKLEKIREELGISEDDFKAYVAMMEDYYSFQHNYQITDSDIKAFDTACFHIDEMQTKCRISDWELYQAMEDPEGKRQTLLQKGATEEQYTAFCEAVGSYADVQARYKIKDKDIENYAKVLEKVYNFETERNIASEGSAYEERHERLIEIVGAIDEIMERRGISDERGYRLVEHAEEMFEVMQKRQLTEKQSEELLNGSEGLRILLEKKQIAKADVKQMVEKGTASKKLQKFQAAVEMIPTLKELVHDPDDLYKLLGI